MELLIMADDLTGSLDSGVQLAKAGLSTMVSYRPSFEILKQRPDLQVLVIDTETRHESAQNAYHRIYELACRARNAGYRRIYKKHDSTLRGNIGSELAALMDGMAMDRLLFAPAYPLLGRLTVNGVQYVDGVPLEQSAFAHDPLNPVSTGRIADVIARQTDIPVVNTSPDRLADAIARAPKRAIIVVDAQSDDDLASIGRQLAGREDILLSGSSGFSAPLPDILGKRGHPPAHLLSPKRALVVCGSVNAVSLAQVQCAAEQGAPLFYLSPAQKNGVVMPSEQDIFRRQIDCALAERGCVMLQTCANPEKMEETGHLEVAGHVGRLASEIIRQSRPELVVVFGGDTLLGVVQSLGDAAIRPQCEAFPGVVQSRLTWPGGAVALVSKAGGFGGRELLAQLLRHYRIWR